jgi:hypothetical protein
LPPRHFRRRRFRRHDERHAPLELHDGASLSRFDMFLSCHYAVMFRPAAALRQLSDIFFSPYADAAADIIFSFQPFSDIFSFAIVFSE